MKRVGILLIGALLAASLGSAAGAASRVKPTIHFFSGAQDDAHWTPKDSSDSNRMSIELEVGPAATGGLGHAGLELQHVEGTPAPLNEPYFDHKEDRASANSGGSPRLVIVFSNGNIQLRPDEWTTSWRRVGAGELGETGNWDVFGGPCVFKFDVTYAEARACFPNGLVQTVILVTDSNWMADKSNGYINWIDQLQYNGFVFSHASDNNNSQNS